MPNTPPDFQQKSRNIHTNTLHIGISVLWGEILKSQWLPWRKYSIFLPKLYLFLAHKLQAAVSG